MNTQRMWGNLLLAAIVACGTSYGAAAQFENSQVTQGDKVTIELKNVTLSGAILEIGRKYKANILCEPYRNDMKVPHMKIEAVPLGVVVKKIGELFQRDTSKIGDIYVLRDRQWHIKPVVMREAVKKYGAGWAPWAHSGKVDIRSAEDPERLRLMSTQAAAVIGALPPSVISMEIDSAPLKAFAAKFGSKVGWPVTFNRDFSDRRISGIVESVSPAKALEAITLLLNASQSAVIGQTDAQRQFEASLSDKRSEGEKMSEELLPELVNMLNADQRGAMGRGEQVPVPLSSMSSALQKRALDYTKLSIDRTWNRASGVSSADMSRLNEFSLVILPPPSTAISVRGVDVNGALIQF